jgi:LAO/AO transport system kinase
MTDWVTEIRAGNRRSLARFLTLVERNADGVDMVLASLFPYTGQAQVVGVTGAPGTGKSTLVTALARAYRVDGRTVGILAVDPTSPYSGGALLGDRIRMQALSGDSGVFVRSTATRGSLGGLARSTQEMIQVLDAAGYDVVIVETVGAGQSEVDIATLAQTTIVIEAPGLGDGVQAIKAGILEIADILVVNKADLPGATNAVRSLKSMMDLGHPTKAGLAGHHGVTAPEMETADTEAPIHWEIPIIQTIATSGEGIDTLIQAIDDHSTYLSGSGVGQGVEMAMIDANLRERLKDALFDEYLSHIPHTALSELTSRIMKRELSPRAAVRVALDSRQANGHKGTSG